MHKAISETVIAQVYKLPSLESKNEVEKRKIEKEKVVLMLQKPLTIIKNKMIISNEIRVKKYSLNNFIELLQISFE